MNNLSIPAQPVVEIFNPAIETGFESFFIKPIPNLLPPVIEPDPVVAVMRQWILTEARRRKYFLTYGYVAEVFGISQPRLWFLLNQMGDEDVAAGRPRTDVLVGRDEPSQGHYKKKKMSPAHNSRWEQIQYVQEEIAKMCNYYNMEFKQRVVLSSGVEKFFLITKGVSKFKHLLNDRKPLKRIVEKQKRLLVSRKGTNKQ